MHLPSNGKAVGPIILNGFRVEVVGWLGVVEGNAVLLVFDAFAQHFHNSFVPYLVTDTLQ